MTIRHLKIFITVAECGKMGQAAEKLFISQPSVSQAIKELEDHYGVRLFERLSRKLYITESGEMLLGYARHIIQSFDEMELQLQYSGQQISLRIGATITVGTCMLYPLVEKFEKKKPEIKMSVVVNNTHIIKQMLLGSQLDVAIIEGDIHHPDLIKECLAYDPLVIAVGKDHPFYGKETITIEELQGFDLICREPGSGVRRLFEEALSAKGVTMPIKWECTTTEAIKTAVMGGQGIAVFSKLMIAKEVKNKKLHMITLEEVNMTREICVVWHKNKFMSAHLTSFLKFVRKQK